MLYISINGLHAALIWDLGWWHQRKKRARWSTPGSQGFCTRVIHRPTRETGWRLASWRKRGSARYQLIVMHSLLHSSDRSMRLTLGFPSCEWWNCLRKVRKFTVKTSGNQLYETMWKQGSVLTDHPLGSWNYLFHLVPDLTENQKLIGSS